MDEYYDATCPDPGGVFKSSFVKCYQIIKTVRIKAFKRKHLRRYIQLVHLYVQ